MARYGAGDHLDSYRIEDVLGAGAYAETYRATDERNGREVVLKVPDPNLFADPAIFNRYQREAEVAKRLDHPGVQGAIDTGDGRTDYLVLRYVEGESLRDRLHTRRGPLPIGTVVDWGTQLATALAYLHRHGIVHRDLKPGNVLVADDGRLVINDFGTAQLAGARRLTWKHLSSSLGTPEYMSPEQAQGGRGDERSDIYAWGVMMYEMLTGGVPFVGNDWMATMAAHLQDNPVAIAKLRHDVPDPLDAVVTHAMRRYPENRYPTAEALLADLTQLEHPDQLSATKYDRLPEKPMGAMTVPGSGKRLWSKLRGRP